MFEILEYLKDKLWILRLVVYEWSYFIMELG